MKVPVNQDLERLRPAHRGAGPAAATTGPWAELGVALVALSADLWWLRTLDHRLPSACAQVLVVLVLVGGALRRRRGEVRLPQPKLGRGRAWLEAAAFTACAVLLLAVVGAFMRVEPVDGMRAYALGWPLGDQFRLLLRGLTRAGLQQLGLQTIVWAAIWEISGREARATTLSALVFGALHLPHLVLAACATALGWAWMTLYRRGGALTAIVVSHVLVAAAAYALLPERALSDLHVGRKALERRAGYQLLQSEESQALLVRACSGDSSGGLGETSAEFVTALWLEVLERSPSVEEIAREKVRIGRFSRCHTAKLLLMSGESLAVHATAH